ncbi:MAG TPA: helix-turn-helix transcriptional regulator, partial [Clostridiales bacterium]|nr:helix-turn-helix transcriptional regulator [Clostridiales bacterium]
MKKPINPRLLSVVSFSFVFAYLLSFLFEGQVLYSIIDVYGVNAHPYILSAIIAHLAGLLTCGFFIKSQQAAKHTVAVGMLICILATIPFFFAPSILWMLALIVLG